MSDQKALTYSTVTVEELKGELSSLGLDSKGTKSVLFARIMMWKAGISQESDFVDCVSSYEDLSIYRIDDLRELAEKLNIAATWLLKADLVSQIVLARRKPPVNVQEKPSTALPAGQTRSSEKGSPTTILHNAPDIEETPGDVEAEQLVNEVIDDFIGRNLPKEPRKPPLKGKRLNTDRLVDMQPQRPRVENVYRDPNHVPSNRWGFSPFEEPEFANNSRVSTATTTKDEMEVTELEHKSGNLRTSRMNIPAISKDPRAWYAFDIAFPNRGCRKILTRSTGLLCGLYAVVNSMAAQFPKLPQPTVQELRDTVRSAEFAQPGVSLFMDNTNNFTVDQLGTILRDWARARHSINIQLGYLLARRGPWLVPTPGTDEGDWSILWIHNDNAEDLAAAQGLDPRAVINHYSGLKRDPHLPLQARQLRRSPAAQDLSRLSANGTKLVRSDRSWDQSSAPSRSKGQNQSLEAAIGDRAKLGWVTTGSPRTPSNRLPQSDLPPSSELRFASRLDEVCLSATANAFTETKPIESSPTGADYRMLVSEWEAAKGTRLDSERSGTATGKSLVVNPIVSVRLPLSQEKHSLPKPPQNHAAHQAFAEESHESRGPATAGGPLNPEGQPRNASSNEGEVPIKTLSSQLAGAISEKNRAVLRVADALRKQEKTTANLRLALQKQEALATELMKALSRPDRLLADIQRHTTE